MMRVRCESWSILLGSGSRQGGCDQGVKRPFARPSKQPSNRGRARASASDRRPAPLLAAGLASCARRAGRAGSSPSVGQQPGLPLTTIARRAGGSASGGPPSAAACRRTSSHSPRLQGQRHARSRRSKWLWQGQPAASISSPWPSPPARLQVLLGRGQRRHDAGAAHRQAAAAPGQRPAPAAPAPAPRAAGPRSAAGARSELEPHRLQPLGAQPPAGGLRPLGVAPRATVQSPCAVARAS